MKLNTKTMVMPFAIIIGTFLIYLGVLLISIWPVNEISLGQSGLFGDTFGALTSLFSGLAFAGLLVTIWQQKEDLSLTRKEIRDQHFENVLFRMLEMHNCIVTDLDLRKKADVNGGGAGSVIAAGRDCFQLFFDRFKKAYEGNIQANITSKEYCNDVYEAFFQKHQSDLGHYFRYLYNIFKFIKESDVDNKKTYTSIVRAQLSDNELLLLFYNSLSKNGVEKFKPLIEEYQLMDNLPVIHLLDKSHTSLFNSSAYNLPEAVTHKNGLQG
jgi:hypothetical protein